MKTWVWLPAWRNPDVMMHSCDPSTQRYKVQDHIQKQTEFKVSPRFLQTISSILVTKLYNENWLKWWLLSQIYLIKIEPLYTSASLKHDELSSSDSYCHWEVSTHFIPLLGCGFTTNNVVWTAFYLSVWKALQCRFSCGLSCSVCFWGSFTTKVFNHPLHNYTTGWVSVCVSLGGRGLFHTKSHCDSAWLQTVNLFPSVYIGLRIQTCNTAERIYYFIHLFCCWQTCKFVLVISGLGCHNQSFNKHFFV